MHRFLDQSLWHDEWDDDYCGHVADADADADAEPSNDDFHVSWQADSLGLVPLLAQLLLIDYAKIKWNRIKRLPKQKARVEKKRIKAKFEQQNVETHRWILGKEIVLPLIISLSLCSRSGQNPKVN